MDVNRLITELRLEREEIEQAPLRSGEAYTSCSENPRQRHREGVRRLDAKHSCTRVNRAPTAAGPPSQE